VRIGLETSPRITQKRDKNNLVQHPNTPHLPLTKVQLQAVGITLLSFLREK
jgi:hypothetical protein